MLDVMIDQARFNARMLDTMLADVPDADRCRQWPHVQNHPAWQVGHLTLVRGLVCGLLGKPLAPEAGWAERFGRGTEPAGDPAAYPDKAALLAGFRRAQEHLLATLGGLRWEDLAKPTPEPRLAERVPTLQHLVTTLIGMHDGYHLGQLAVWRAAAGLPSALG